MPIGIKQGSRVEVAAQFSDSAGTIIVMPAGAASLHIAYTSISGSSATTSISMASAGFDLVAAWNSSVAAIGQPATISFVFGTVTLSPPDPTLRICQNTGA